VTGEANGTIGSNGLYTAPALVPHPTTLTVTASAQADPSRSATGKINVLRATNPGHIPKHRSERKRRNSDPFSDGDPDSAV